MIKDWVVRAEGRKGSRGAKRRKRGVEAGRWGRGGADHLRHTEK